MYTYRVETRYILEKICVYTSRVETRHIRKDLCVHTQRRDKTYEALLLSNDKQEKIIKARG